MWLEISPIILLHRNKVLQARDIHLKVRILKLSTKAAYNIFDALNKIYLVAMYIDINSICTLENLVCYKRQRSALSRNTRSYYRCIRLKVWNWSFFAICEVSAVESSSITVKFFSKLQLMNIFLRFLFCSRSQYFLTSFYDCPFDVTSNLLSNICEQPFGTIVITTLLDQQRYWYRFCFYLILCETSVDLITHSV